MSEARFTPHYLLENLRDVYFAERTGTLTLRRGPDWRRLFFERGMLAFADSSQPAEKVEAILAEAGQAPAVSAAAGEGSEAIARVSEWRTSGRVGAEALDQAARLAVQRVVDGAFRWDGGTWTFEDGPVEAPAFAPDVLFTFEVFQRGVQQMANFEPLKEVLLAEERQLRLNENAFLPIQSLNLGAEQGYILSRVDGTLRAHEVIMVAPEGSEDRVLRMLFGFLVLGVVLFDPPPGEGMFSLRSLMEGHRDERQQYAAERERVLGYFEKTRGVAPHEVLQVEEGAGPEVIKRSYEALLGRFSRDRLSPRVRADLKREIGIIENRLLEAYLRMQSAAIERLTPFQDQGKELEVTSRAFEKRKELVKSEAQETEEGRQRLAEGYFLKAKDYFKDGDYFNCIQYCKLAVKFNDREAPFFSLMGDALLKNPDHRWQRLAEESYLRASEIDPWNADYLVALGKLYREQGLAMRARKQFEKALEILPHHNAAREELRSLGRG
ncbi:MAG: tetratricopeptide repeat protein [Acidobacteriota bacterium]|jgi:hypothetical protein